MYKERDREKVVKRTIEYRRPSDWVLYHFAESETHTHTNKTYARCSINATDQLQSYTARTETEMNLKLIKWFDFPFNLFVFFAAFCSVLFSYSLLFFSFLSFLPSPVLWTWSNLVSSYLMLFLYVLCLPNKDKAFGMSIYRENAFTHFPFGFYLLTSFVFYF